MTWGTPPGDLGNQESSRHGVTKIHKTWRFPKKHGWYPDLSSILDLDFPMEMFTIQLWVTYHHDWGNHHVDPQGQGAAALQEPRCEQTGGQVFVLYFRTAIWMDQVVFTIFICINYVYVWIRVYVHIYLYLYLYLQMNIYIYI